MKNVYLLVKFWVLIKVAQMKLKKISVDLASEKQESLRSFLSDIIDRMSVLLMVTSPKLRRRKIWRKFSEEIVDVSIGLRNTYLFPVWDNLVYNAVDLRNLTYPER